MRCTHPSNFFHDFFTHVTDFAEKDGLLVVHDFLKVC